MKKITILFFLFLSFQSVNAQQLEVGMEFHYLHTPFRIGVTPIDTQSFKIAHISEVINTNGDNAFVINNFPNTGIANANVLLYQDGDKMYYQLDSLKHLLADFSLLVGDTFKMKHPFAPNASIGSHGFPIDSTFFRIDSVGIFEQNGKSIPYQILNFIDDDRNNSYPADWWKVYKGIGGAYTMLPDYPLGEGGSCLYKVKYPDGTEIIFDDDCKLFSSTKNLTEEELNIFPNPVIDILDISQLPNFQKIRIYDSLGKLVKEVENHHSKIDCSQLPNGFYMLVLILEDNQKISTKFIKK